MASMNWLGFSLNPQDVTNSQELPNTNIEGYDLAHQHSTAPNFHSSFGILDSLHRDNQTQDWNSMIIMSTITTTTTTNTSSASTCNNQEPKLENFLGSSHSFREAPTYDYSQVNGGDYLFTNPRSGNDDNDNNGINVSMIQTWLRSQQSTENKNDTTGVQALMNSQALSLSMISGGGSGGGGVSFESESNKIQSDNTKILPGVTSQSGAIIEAAGPKKPIETFGQRTSIYRGVTRHRWTGRYEAHLWDNSFKREGQTRKGKQGGFDKEDKAARAYDLAAIKYWGTTTTTNFPFSKYEKEIEEMKHMTRQEYIASIRRKSSGFSRGASMYRGVTRHHQHGRWQARIGRVAGNKDLYLGTFTTQEEAAEAYDIAAIKFRGLNAVTNFEINKYDVNAILDSSTLPIGGGSKRLKEVDTQIAPASGSHLASWPAIALQQAQALNSYYQQERQLAWCKQEQQQHQQDSDHHLVYNNGFHNQSVMENGYNFMQNNPSYSLMGLSNSSAEVSSDNSSYVYGAGNNNGGFGNENMFGYANLYNQSVSGGGQPWITTAVPMQASKANNLAFGNGAQTFTVWNDS
ncbi:hypothetical protein V2J09_023680 [Rumex salicifolius]